MEVGSPNLTEDAQHPQLISPEPARFAEVSTEALSAGGIMYPFKGCEPRAAGLEYILTFTCTGLFPRANLFKTPFR